MAEHPEVIRPKPKVKMLELPCKCIYKAEHTQGERMYDCGHHNWIIRAHIPREVHYTVELPQRQRLTTEETLRSPTVKDLFG